MALVIVHGVEFYIQMLDAWLNGMHVVNRVAICRTSTKIIRMCFRNMFIGIRRTGEVYIIEKCLY